MKIKEIFKKANEEGFALGHFNFAQNEALRAIVQAAASLKTPIFVGTSEGESRHLGLKQAVYLVKASREEFGIPIWLNADHTKSFEGVKAAVDAGYDAVLADFSAKPFEENLKLTKQAVIYAKSKNPDIIVEGELGLLRGESKIQKEKIVVKPEDLADPEKARYFAEETKVDLLAPAVGNVHGIVLEGEESLDFERIKAIKNSVPGVFLVLHGASGITAENLKKAVLAGISQIHINTEIRVAFVDSIRKNLSDMPSETTPYKILAPGIKAMQDVIEEKLRIFGSVNKI